MATSTLTSKWQMVLPKAIREHLNVQPGDQLDFVIRDNGEVVMTPALTDVRELKGMLRRPGKPVTLQQMQEAIHRGARRSM